MHTITVDDERFAVHALLRLLRKYDPDGTHEGVLHASEFLDYLEAHPVDVAFVDVELTDSNGIALTRRVAEKYPEVNVVIYTGHPEYKADAMDVYASACLIKPVDMYDLEDAMDHLRHQLRKIRVQCFGYFEVFAGDTPLNFTRKDSKEVLAYLIDKRGASVSLDELRCVIWSEDEDSAQKKNYIRNIISDIRNAFARYGVRDVICNSTGYYAVDTSKLRCDFYDYLDGKFVPAARLGEYMEQFNEWSNATKIKLFGKM